MDLNCDLGELEDAAHEAALMGCIRSANIACGGHAGDSAMMERTVRLALERGVRIGAHPSYPDRANFGRIEMPLPAEEIARTVRQQIERLDAIVQRCGGAITHIKPHGALYNAAARDGGIARAIGEGVAQWRSGAEVYGLAGSKALGVWRSMGLSAIGEGFADRRYEPDGSLRPRKFADALITDPQEAAAQAVRLAQSGTVQTICVHGDSPGAVEILQAVSRALS